MSEIEVVSVPAPGEAPQSKTEDTSTTNAEAKKDTVLEETEQKAASEKIDSDEIDTQDSDTEENESGDDEVSGAKPKKKSGFQRRIDKLNKKISAMAQELELQRMEALKQRAGGEKPVEAKPEKQSEGKPDKNDFESHDDYLEALADWKFEQRQERQRQESRESQVKSEFENKVSDLRKHSAEFSKTREDFNEVISDVDDVPMSLTVQNIILDAGAEGPALMYEIAKNRKEYERINALSPLAAAKEIGKIEARLQEAIKKPIEKKTTNTPTPITPIKAKGSAIEKPLGELDYEEYRKVRLEQMQKNRR